MLLTVVTELLYLLVQYSFAPLHNALTQIINWLFFTGSNNSRLGQFRLNFHSHYKQLYCHSYLLTSVGSP